MTRPEEEAEEICLIPSFDWKSIGNFTTSEISDVIGTPIKVQRSSFKTPMDAAGPPVLLRLCSSLQFRIRSYCTYRVCAFCTDMTDFRFVIVSR